MNAALADTQMKARAQVNGWELAGGPAAVLSELVEQDMKDYPEVVRRLGIKGS